MTDVDGVEGTRWELLPDGEIRLSYPEISTMSIRNGDEIVIETPGESEPNYVRHLISGLGMGLILHQRGFFTLHASVVAVGDFAIGIAGAKRSGKSTTAAMLADLGHRLLSDDVLAVDLRNGGPLSVLAGMPTVNLWPDSVIAVGRDPESLPKIWSEGTKRVTPVSAEQSRSAYPLSDIFFLEPLETIEQPSLEPLSAAEAIPLLIGNSHVLRLVEDRETMPIHLTQCADLTERVRLHRLKRPLALDSIRAVAALIEEQVGIRSRQPAAATGIR